MLNGSGESRHICCILEFSGERSAFHCWVLCWPWVYFIMLCPLYTQFGESFFLIKNGCWIYQMLFLYAHLRWSLCLLFILYAFPFFDSYSSQDGLSCAALIDSSQLSVVLLHRDICSSVDSGSVHGTTRAQMKGQWSHSCWGRKAT